MGKGWAKGLTALTDPRVARMAAAMTGRKRGPYRQRDRRALSGPEWNWTPDIAYAVGLIATDGNLSPSGRHVSLTSNDRDLLETFLECIQRSAKIGNVRGGYGTSSLRVQIGDVGLYRWLLSIGLTPRKSLTLGALSVPDDVFPHVLRGLLDGDGSILDVTYDGTGKARGRRYRTLLVRFHSASQPHLIWIRERVRVLYGVSGSLAFAGGLYRLTFAKRASLALLPLLYRTADVRCLMRKRRIWLRFVMEAGSAARQPNGPATMDEQMPR